MTHPTENHGHTQRDADALRAAGVDPASTQPREHRVPCWCGVLTLHQSAGCDHHYEPPFRAR